MESLRTFIALDIKVDNLLCSDWNYLKQILLRERVKWVQNKVLHLTLLFLGETPGNVVDSISEKLNHSLPLIRTFKLSIKGLGVFGNPLSPKVIWVGSENSSGLLILKKSIDDTILPLGYGTVEKSFIPHITLGRGKDIKPNLVLKKYIDDRKDKFYQEVQIDEVTFYQSILRSEGPEYRPIKIIKLLSP